MSRPQQENRESPHERLLKGAAIALSLFASACFMAAAIGSESYWWLGLITLLPLFNAIRILSPVRAGACGAFCFIVTRACYRRKARSRLCGDFVSQWPRGELRAVAKGVSDVSFMIPLKHSLSVTPVEKREDR